MTESELVMLKKSELIRLALVEYEDMLTSSDIFDCSTFYTLIFGRVRCCFGGLLIRYLLRNGELVLDFDSFEDSILKHISDSLRDRVLFLDCIRRGRLRWAYHNVDNKTYKAIFGDTESIGVTRDLRLDVDSIMRVAGFLESKGL